MEFSQEKARSKFCKAEMKMQQICRLLAKVSVVVVHHAKESVGVLDMSRAHFCHLQSKKQTNVPSTACRLNCSVKRKKACQPETNNEKKACASLFPILSDMRFSASVQHYNDIFQHRAWYCTTSTSSIHLPSVHSNLKKVITSKMEQLLFLWKLCCGSGD